MLKVFKKTQKAIRNKMQLIIQFKIKTIKIIIRKNDNDDDDFLIKTIN